MLRSAPDSPSLQPPGPVVVPFGAAFKAKGYTRTTAATARAILSGPGGFYVNVHNARYPAGAVRGQLRGY